MRLILLTCALCLLALASGCNRSGQSPNNSAAPAAVSNGLNGDRGRARELLETGKELYLNDDDEQAVQAFELVGVLNRLNEEYPSMPIIVTGDFNSDPNDDHTVAFGTPYKQLTDAGYLDLWALRPGSPKGFTCCQDDGLLNTESALYERVDLIFSSDEPKSVKVNVVGDNSSDMTPSGLWPSDHAGVAARMQFAP